MQIKRISALTGRLNTRNIPIRDAAHLALWKRGELIQHVFSYLSPEDREFLISGVTPEEWDEMARDEEEQQNVERGLF